MSREVKKRGVRIAIDVSLFWSLLSYLGDVMWFGV